MAAGDLSPDSATCQPEVEVNFLKLLLEKKEEKRSVGKFDIKFVAEITETAFN